MTSFFARVISRARGALKWFFAAVLNQNGGPHRLHGVVRFGRVLVFRRPLYRSDILFSLLVLPKFRNKRLGI